MDAVQSDDDLPQSTAYGLARFLRGWSQQGFSPQQVTKSNGHAWSFEHNHDARLTCTEQFGRLQEARVRALTHGLRMH